MQEDNQKLGRVKRSIIIILGAYYTCNLHARQITLPNPIGGGLLNV
jgi:hypothetical protein